MVLFFHFSAKKIPGTPLSDKVIIKAKDGIYLFSHRRNDFRAGVVTEVSPCGKSFQVRVLEWPSITTKGQYYSSHKGSEVVAKEMVYSKLKIVKASSSLGTTLERANVQYKFPDLFDIFKRRGATKSKKVRTIADAFKKGPPTKVTKAKK